MPYRSRTARNRPSNNYCPYNSPGYGYGLGSCNNYSSGYSGNSNTFSSAGYGGNRGNTFSSTGYRGGLRTGDEDTFSDCNQLGRDLRTCHRKACLNIVVIPTVVIVSMLIFTGVILGGVLGAVYSGSSSTTERVRDPSVLNLSPGVTRDVSFGNTFFCSEVTLEANGSRGAGASVYLIKDTPPLTHMNSFTRRVMRSGFLISNFYSRKYRLYSGTNVITSLYMSRALFTGTFSVYKSGSRDRPIATSPVTCTVGYSYSRRLSFQVQDEADYYFLYQRGRFGRGGTSCTFPGSIPFELQLNISASWFVHSTSGLTTAPRCSATTGRQCSLDVPADSNYRALIVTDLPTNNGDLSENIRIRLHCSSTRGWAYAVVVLVPLLLVVGVTITTVILVVCWCWKKRASRQSHNTQTTTEEAAPTSAVQLQEMDPQGPQQPATDQKDNKTTSDSQNDEQQHHVLTAAPPPSYKDSLDYPAQKSAVPPPYSKE